MNALAAPPTAPPDMTGAMRVGKMCTGCGEWLAFAAFSRRRSRSDGRQCRCKACNRVWKEANRERVAETNRAWYEANRERKAETRRAWHEANRERKAETDRAWREANRERHAETIRAWREANYAARKASGVCTRGGCGQPAAEGITRCVDCHEWLLSRSWRRVLPSLQERDVYRCYLCGGDVPEGDAHLEHVLARANGGTNDEWNVSVAHSACNFWKSARSSLGVISEMWPGALDAVVTWPTYRADTDEHLGTFAEAIG